MRIYLLMLSCLLLSLTARGATESAPTSKAEISEPTTSAVVAGQTPTPVSPATTPTPVTPASTAQTSAAAAQSPAASAAPATPTSVATSNTAAAEPPQTDEVSTKEDDAPAAPAGRVVKLQPRVRTTSLSVVPSIPLDIIRPFLNGTRIVNKEDMRWTPYIVAPRDNSIISSSHEEVLVKWLRRAGTRNYSVFRVGSPYIHPQTKEVLGYEALDLGYGSVVQWGDPSVVKLYDTNQEVVVGDRLLPQDSTYLRTKYILRRPSFHVNSSILSVLGGVDLVGQYSVIVIVGGTRDGLGVGDRLGIYTNHPPFQDPTDTKCKTMVYPPKELAGELLVFRTFNRLSLGVVLKALKTIEIGDNVSNL